MQEKSLESYGFRGPKPRNLGIIVALLILFIILWSTFVIVPAGSRGVVLWWGKVENRIMGEGLNFKVPITETVIKVDVRVQPHPFKEIDASSKEYQIVKMTGMMNFHIDPAFVNDLYQKVGLDFAAKVIDLLRNEETRAEFGRKSREWVIKNYDWSSHMNTLEALIQRCGNCAIDRTEMDLSER